MAGNPRLACDHIDEEPKKILTAIRGYEREPLVSLEEACESLAKIVDDIDHYVYIAIQNCKRPEDHLTQDESASIHLYTMEWNPSEDSLYAILNRTLRKPERALLKPWFKYLKLFITALLKLPTYEGILWRGVCGDLTSLYSKGENQIWWSFSSCARSLDVLNNRSFIGDSGIRTMFCILDSKGGRNISKHSHFATEDEIILLPGAVVEMNSVLKRKDGLNIVQLRQITSSREFLVLPNVEEGKQLITVREQSESKKTVNQASIFVDSDDDNYSSDGRPIFKRHGKYPTSEVSYASNHSEVSEYSSSSAVIMKGDNERRSGRNSSNPIRISYADRAGNYIILENTGNSNCNITGWCLTQTIGDVKNAAVFEFPKDCILKPRLPVHVLSRTGSKKSNNTRTPNQEMRLVADHLLTWGTGSRVITRVIDVDGSEQATFIQK